MVSSGIKGSRWSDTRVRGRSHNGLILSRVSAAYVLIVTTRLTGGARADNYETVCHVVVDTKKIPHFVFISPIGLPCFIKEYKVVYTYGQTEFSAQLRWKEEVRDEFYRFR